MRSILQKEVAAFKEKNTVAVGSSDSTTTVVKNSASPSKDQVATWRREVLDAIAPGSSKPPTPVAEVAPEPPAAVADKKPLLDSVPAPTSPVITEVGADLAESTPPSKPTKTPRVVRKGALGVKKIKVVKSKIKISVPLAVSAPIKKSSVKKSVKSASVKPRLKLLEPVTFTRPTDSTFVPANSFSVPTTDFKSSVTHSTPPIRSARMARFWGIAAPVCSFIVLAYLSCYLFRLDVTVPQLAQWLPWPAAYIDGTTVSVQTLHEVTGGLAALSAKSTTTITPRSVERLAFEKLTTDTIVEHEINQRKLAVPASAVQASMKDFSAQFGTLAAQVDFIARTYGWSERQFEQYILLPEVREQILNKALNQDPAALAQAKLRSTKLREKIIAKEIDFSAAARTGSDDPSTASNGGDLGWITGDGLDTAIVARLKTLNVGEISEPILTSTGYHLLYLQAVKGATAGKIDTKAFKLAHILIIPVTFSRWLDARIANATIVPLVRIGR